MIFVSVVLVRTQAASMLVYSGRPRNTALYNIPLTDNDHYDNNASISAL